jgi:hypothetical protein
MAPIGFSTITPDGLLCRYCATPTTEQQRTEQNEAWLAGVLCEDSEDDEEDSSSDVDDDDEKARGGVEPPTSSKKF